MPNLFKINILRPLPPGAKVVGKGADRSAVWTEGDRRRRAPVVTTRKGNRIVAGESSCWYGKVRVAPKVWRKVRLFSDKVASERELMRLQVEADRRAAGVITAEMDRLARPVPDLAKDYIESLRVQKKDPEHVRISEWMLNKLVDACGWRQFRDITPASVEKALPSLATTASYQNKFIVRVKAFVHWVLPDGCADPLKKLKRVREKGAKKTRDRRAAKQPDLQALFALDIPDDRKLAYALAAFNGLRRNEARRLTADDVYLNATIGFMGFRRKQGQDDAQDYIPIHPYVLKLLAGRMLMPGARVLPSVPDMKTLARDLLAAGVATPAAGPGPGCVCVAKGNYINIGNARGQRLDYHALRHTFQTGLDQTGCSRATKKKLMRHASGDVTDGYAHAELAEMFAAIARLPDPTGGDPVTPAVGQTAVKTGTDGLPVSPGQLPGGPNAGPLMDQAACESGRLGANCVNRQDRAAAAVLDLTRGTRGGVTLVPSGNKSHVDEPWQPLSTADLKPDGTPAILCQTGPSTQVD